MQALQVILSGVAQGCIYGLIALGFVLIYKATETVTFAQGELMMLGAFTGLACVNYLGWPFGVSVVVSMLIMAGMGWLIERVVINPVLGEPAFAIVMLDQSKQLRAELENAGFVQNFFVQKRDDRDIAHLGDVDPPMRCHAVSRSGNRLCPPLPIGWAVGLS
jgi:ABC-type branched-subunit amino acid transport system permease subunit